MKNDYKGEIEKNGVVAFVPGGNSMWPTLKNEKQSVIIVKPDGRLKEKDVALYLRDNGLYVLHRVMEVKDGGYVFMGDSQFVTEFVKDGNIVGVMTGFYRGKKYIDVGDPKYIKEVDDWFRRKKRRKIKLAFFRFRVKVANKLKRIFGRKSKKRKEENGNDFS